MQLLAKIMGDPNKRDLRAIQPLVAEIDELELRIKELTDEELRVVRCPDATVMRSVARRQS